MLKSSPYAGSAKEQLLLEAQVDAKTLNPMRGTNISYRKNF